MNLLGDADEYKLIRDHVDAVYYNGDNKEEKQATKQMISANIENLSAKGINADTRNEYLDDWSFLQLQ